MLQLPGRDTRSDMPFTGGRMRGGRVSGLSGRHRRVLRKEGDQEVEGWPSPFWSYHERQRTDVRGAWHVSIYVFGSNIGELSTLIKSRAANHVPNSEQ
jgi:hypothetical protein